MARNETIERARKDAEAGHWGRARDRLHGLLQLQPGDLEIRRELATIYRALHHPVMAGRYWYFETERTAEMDAAVAAFERACGNNAGQILRMLKIQRAEQLPAGPAREKFTELTGRATVRRTRERPEPSRWADAWATAAGYGCMALFALGMVLAMIGLLTVLRSLFD